MRKLIAIARHPVDYFDLVRLREWVVMLQASAMLLKIDEPSVWDVDRIRQNINDMYEVFHKDPNVLNENKVVCRHLFWTLLLSRFKKLEISRERAKYVLDFYELMKSSFKDKNELIELIRFLNEAVEMFGKI